MRISFKHLSKAKVQLYITFQMSLIPTTKASFEVHISGIYDYCILLLEFYLGQRMKVCMPNSPKSRRIHQN